MSYVKDAAIVAQNSATAAAAIYASLGLDGWDPELYEDIRTSIFNGSLALAGAESVVEVMEATEKSGGRTTSARGASRGGRGGYGSGRSSGGSSRGGDPGTVEIRNGKHQGKTIAQVADEDPDWLDWAAENLNNDFLRTKVEEFLAKAA